MTQSSFPWDGTTTGDASIAPYNSSEFSRFFGKILASDAAGFVIPEYANLLRVVESSPAAASVRVFTGAAYVKGYFYESDAIETLTIAANASGNPRLDRIVLRVDFTAQTVRLAVLQGTPAATPALPALTQTYGTTWEISLAYIWVANGFATIVNAEIHEERRFMQTAGGLAVSDLSNGNLIFNSEFMAYSDLPTAPPTLAPEGWAVFGTIPTIVSATKPATQPRGRALQMTATSVDDGLEQTFIVPPSTMIAIKVPVNVTAGDVGAIQVTTNSGAPQTITRTLRRTGAFIEHTIYYVTESDATTMTVRQYCVNNTDVVQIGQTLAVVGYWPGQFRQIHETIHFIKSLTDVNWTITAKSNGVTTITLSSSFGSIILAGVTAVILRIQGNDSGSGAGGPAMHITPVGLGGGTNAAITLLLNGVPNDAPRSLSGEIILNSSLQFDIVILGAGAGTFDATVVVKGIHT